MSPRTITWLILFTTLVNAFGVTRVRVSMMNLPPSGEGAERVVRWTVLPVQGQAAQPAP